MRVKYGKKISAAMVMILVACCVMLVVSPFCVQAAKKPAVPKKPKIVTDTKGDAASGIRVFAKYKKVKGVSGYQIKTTYIYKGSDNQGPAYKTTKKIKTKKTKQLLTKNGNYIKVAFKVRSYKIKKGKKIYSNWSRKVTKKF